MALSDFTERIDSVIKRDDIRGVYGENINTETARVLGENLADIFREATAVHPVNVVIGHDMRLSGGVLASALAEGLSQGGCRPISLGLAGTELVGFLVAHYSEFIDGGIIITASHNPADNNGFKFFGRKGLPLPVACELPAPLPKVPLERLALGMKKAKIPSRLHWDDFAPDYIKTAVGKGQLDFDKASEGATDRLRVVVEAGNGMGGRITREFAKLAPQFEWFFSNETPDGRFPITVPNPLQPAYQKMVAERVQEHAAHVGMCFDGDADRVALADENGDIISPPLLATLIGKKLREKLGPDCIIAHNMVCSWAVADTLGDRREVLGDAGTFITPVGYGRIKPIMFNNQDIAFGAEHSGHYMFRDFYTADSGMLAGLIVLELAAELHAAGRTLSSELAELRERYQESGEINFEMPASRPTDKVIEEAIDTFESDAKRIYGVAEEGVKPIKKFPPKFKQAVSDVRVECDDWWFCLRKSGTEGSGGGLCRLYVEAVGDKQLMEQKRDELVNLIGEQYRMAE